MSLSKLSSEVLSSVFNNRAMPLFHRLRLRLLSNRCCEVIEDGLKKKRTLVIRDRNCPYPELNPDDLIKSTSLTEESINQLVRLFPALTQLTLSLGRWGRPSTSWAMVPSLLTKLATTLKTVKLYGDRPCLFQGKPLATALTSLSALTSLTLDDEYLCRSLLPQLGSILSGLEKFACSMVPPSSAFISSSLSPRCTHLMLFGDVFTFFPNDFSIQLSASLTHLHLVEIGAIHWPSIIRMRRLTSLTLGFNSMTTLDYYLLSPLSLLTRLTDAKLFHLYFLTPLALPSEKAPPLCSMKYLTLQVDFASSRVNYISFFRAIDVWFPNLKCLTLFCDPDVHSTIQDSLKEIPFSVELLPYELFITWGADW